MANITINGFGRASAVANDGILVQTGLTSAGENKSISISVGATNNDYIPTLGKVNDLIGGKQASSDALSSIASQTYVSTSFLQLTAADTYTIRTIAEMKEDLDITSGDLTEDTSDILTITGGTGATLDDVSILVKTAATGQSGYLTSTDWNTFNGKQTASDALSSIASQTYVSMSFLQLTATDTYTIRTIAQVKSDLSLDLVTNESKTTMFISPTFAISITGSYLTASEMLITDGSKGIVSAPVATYPSLTELSYVKGVTSAIQTQIDNAGGGGASQAMYIESNIPNNNSELALHFELGIYSDATFDTLVETFNSSSSQANIELFDGTDWVAMPAGGAIPAYYGNHVRFALQTAVAGTNYYTRIRTLYNSTGSTWVALSDWFASTYPNYSMIIPELPAVAIKALTGGSNTPASHLHKHPAVEYDEGAESGAVSLDFSRGNYQTMATVSETPITSITMSNSIAGDVLEIEVDNANATTVTPKATELIGAGETGKYIITLRNIGGTIMVDKTKTEIE